MRVLRTTMFADAYSPPLTTVMRDSDAKDSLDSVRDELQSAAPEYLTICEIFDMPDDSIENATFEAMRRAQKREIPEKHMAMLFYWLAAMFLKGRFNAVIGMPKRAPLSAEDMRYVLELLCAHPHYRDYSIIGVSEDGTPVQVVKGRVE